MNSSTLRTIAILWIVGLLMPPASTAQVIEDSSRIEQQLETPATPTVSPSITVPKSDDFAPPAGAEAQVFDLSSLTIEGATVYSSDQFKPFYQDLLGQQVSLADLYAVAQQITALYRQDGYILSVAIIPEQTIDSGAVKLRVVEGYIESIEIQDAPAKSESKIRAFLNQIKRSRPLNVKALERYLLLANDLAGFEVKSILRRGESLGTATLVAKVNYDPIDPFFDLTNRGSSEVGNVRLQVGTLLNSQFGQGERLTLRAATSPEDFEELLLGSVSLDVPVGSDGLRLSVGTVYTETNPGELLRLNDINGRSVFAEVGASYPLIRSRTANLLLGAGFDYADTRNIADLPLPGVVISQDRLAILRLSLAGDRQDSSGIFQGSVALSQGIAGTTPANATQPLSRAAGSAVFTKVEFNASRVQKLPAQLLGVFQAKAQVSGDSLLVREQFGLGGARFGSAFNPDELLGDYGFGLRAELQRPFFYRAFGRSLVTQPYLFSDIGKVYRHQPTAVENTSDALASAGLGVRQSFGDELSLAMEVAFPLEQSDQPVDYDPRFFFSLTGFF